LKKNIKGISTQVFETFIKPKKDENSMENKKKNLITLAKKQLNYKLIAEEIVNSVISVLKIN